MESALATAVQMVFHTNENGVPGYPYSKTRRNTKSKFINTRHPKASIQHLSNEKALGSQKTRICHLATAVQMVSHTNEFGVPGGSYSETTKHTKSKISITQHPKTTILYVSSEGALSCHKTRVSILAKATQMVYYTNEYGVPRGPYS